MPPSTADKSSTTTTRINPRCSGFMRTSRDHVSLDYSTAGIRYLTGLGTLSMMNEHRKRLPHLMLSIPHMIVVFIVVLVVFGPHKLPELARGLGKLMAEFRKASTDFKSAFEQEMRDIERQTMLAERKKAADAAAASAAAATPQSPAAPATLDGADTRLAEGAFGPATEGGDATDSSAPNDTRATEALVVTPVAEGVARGTEENTLETSN